MESRKHYNIAVIFPTWHSFLTDIMEGVLAIHSIRKHCRFRHFISTDFSKSVNFPQGYKPDAVLVSYDEDYIDTDWLDAITVPVVNVFGSDKKKYPSVTSDLESVAKIVVNHFATLGFERIGYLGTCDQPASIVMDAIIRKECDLRNIPYWSVYIPDGIESGVWARLEEAAPELREHIVNCEDRTGVYASHDTRGRLLVDYCMDLGVSIPEKIGVLGRFDSINARLCTPELSSVVIPAKQIGRQAIQLLIQLIEGNEIHEYHPKVKITELRVRQSTIVGSDPDMVVIFARAIIRENACNGLTVDELIQSLPLSRSSFEKRYRTLMGLSPAQDIRGVRVKAACDLLLTTQKPVDEIALDVGFSDSRPFVVFFKREVGQTPGDFRRKPCLLNLS